LVYINDLVDDLESNCSLFADDASLFQRLFKNNQDAIDILNRDLVKIHAWCNKWLVKINVLKTKAILFSRKRAPSPELPLYLNDQIIQNVLFHKQLGMVLSRPLDWSEHISDISTKCVKRIGAWKSLQYKLSRRDIEMCMSLFVVPILDYGDILYDNCSEQNKSKLEDVYLAAARVAVGAKRGTSHARLYSEVGW
jgi:hypothetical protein